MNFLKNKKVAIVYDRVNKWGGAERVLLALHKLFPKAPLYTSVYDPKKAAWARAFPDIRTSFLQQIPFAKRWHEGLAWLMPIAFETFDFSEFDLVISVTSEAAKGVITKPTTKHICYMLTPTRYLWSHNKFYFKNPILKFVSKPVIGYLKKWDKVAAGRPDKIIAISKTVQKRIKKYYGLDSGIVYPPTTLKVDDSRMNNSQKKKIKNRNKDKEYYLVVSRLVGYKKVDLVIDVFNKNKKSLVIVGKGRMKTPLRMRAKRNISFKDNIGERELIKTYSNAKAVIMPQEEDFGLVSVEAQMLGIPVIAFSKGGAKESVIDNKTGVLFNSQTHKSLSQAIAKFEKISFNHNYISKNAKRFEEESFKKSITRSLIRTYSGRWRRNTPLASVKK